MKLQHAKFLLPTPNACLTPQNELTIIGPVFSKKESLKTVLTKTVCMDSQITSLQFISERAAIVSAACREKIVC